MHSAVISTALAMRLKNWRGTLTRERSRWRSHSHYQVFFNISNRFWRMKIPRRRKRKMIRAGRLCGSRRSQKQISRSGRNRMRIVRVWRCGRSSAIPRSFKWRRLRSAYWIRLCGSNGIRCWMIRLWHPLLTQEPQLPAYSLLSKRTNHLMRSLLMRSGS